LPNQFLQFIHVSRIEIWQTPHRLKDRSRRPGLKFWVQRFDRNANSLTFGIRKRLFELDYFSLRDTFIRHRGLLESALEIVRIRSIQLAGHYYTTWCHNLQSIEITVYWVGDVIFLPRDRVFQR
jgi:hypothetical protein